MTEQNTTSTPQEATPPLTKLILEVGPLCIFWIVYFQGVRFFGVEEGREIFAALKAYLPAFALAFLYTVYKERTIPKLLLITAIIVSLSGGATLLFENKYLTYVKPTIINLTYAGLLAGGLLTGRLFLKMLLAQGFELADAAWRTLTWRFISFFVGLAVLNEVIWRNFSEPFWVNFKLAGVLPLTLLFIALQAPFIMKHQQNVEQKAD